MSTEFIKSAIKRNLPHFKKYRKYIIDNPWQDIVRSEPEEGTKGKYKSTVDLRLEEFRVQEELIKAIFERLKTFVKKAEGDHHLKAFKDFVKETLDIITIHTDRADDYISDTNISTIKDKDLRASEIAFHNILFKSVSSIDENITNLNIKDDSADTNGIEFLNGTKAPLSMHHILSEIYPEINKKLEQMGIDFKSEPNNEMHIYTPNAPVWNTEKHYWEQEKDTLQYYVDEFKKLRKGIRIDGYYFSGWMYYHMNVFVTPIPHEVWNETSQMFESEDKIINPPLRDSDVNIFENYENARRKNILFTFIAATRRAAKTTLETSKLGHASTIGKKELLCAGGSTKDLNQIAKNFKTDVQFKNRAFAVYNVSNDWKNKVEMGLKTKSNKTITLSVLNIINTDGGNNVEILAGYTPDEFVFDELMKGKFIKALQGLKPALKGANGLIRCFGLLSATGGDEELSKDGYIVLKDPEKNDILPMDWELLERGVPDEYKTWREDRNTPFGTFIPGQMCVDMPKFESNLADFIGKKNCKNLEKIKIKVTDWENATKNIQKERDNKRGNKIAYTQQVVYIPIKPSEIFMSGKVNPFPYEVGIKHLERIRLAGTTGKKVDLTRNGNRVEATFSQKELPEFPFSGGFHDSPVVLFEDIPEIKPPRGLYCMSLDDYKQEQSGTDSVGCFIIYKRQSGNDFRGDKISAIYSSRPDPHRKFHMWGHMLAEAYNCEGSVLMENEDMEFKVFLDGLKQTDKYLVPRFNVSADLSIKGSAMRQYGISPAGNKSAIINKAINYANEIIFSKDENGEDVQSLGIERIDCELLLEEMINYKEGENHDRITTFGIALIQAHKMDAEYVPIRLTEPVVVQQQSTFTKSPIRINHRSALR